MNYYIGIIIILIIILVCFKIKQEKLVSSDLIVPEPASRFIGKWVSNGTATDTLIISYAGQQSLLDIEIQRNFYKPWGVVKTFKENPPIFRLIPINSNEIVLVSMNPTYSFQPIRIKRIDENNSSYLLVDHHLHKGKKYIQTVD